MKVSSSKENILKKIRQALANPVPVPFPQSEGKTTVFQPLQKDLEIEFAENFTGLLGKFLFCIDEREFAEQLLHLVQTKKIKSVFCNEKQIKQKLINCGFTDFSADNVASCDVSITGCELLIARTGSILMSSTQSGRTASVYAPVHICVAYSNQLVYDIKEGLQMMKEKYAGKLPSLITLATGSSRTADIEKTLVVGVHGPGEVYVFLVEQ